MKAVLSIIGSFLFVAAMTWPASPQTGRISSPPLVSSVDKVYEFKNGSWFDGHGFQRRTFYAVDGVLTEKRPSAIGKVVDLDGGWVLPPFGDAHCHHFDSPRNVAQQTQMYLREGIFYALVLTDIRSGAE